MLASLPVRTLFTALVAVFGVCASANAQDSDDLTVSIGKGEAVQLTKVDNWDIALGPADNTIGFWEYEWDYLCVFSSTGRFNVSVSGSNSGSAFVARSSDNTPMSYEVWSYSRVALNFDAPVRHDGPFTLTNLSGSTSLTCADEGFQNSNLFFAPLVRGVDYNLAPPGIYTDVVTIIVSPE